MTAMLVWQSVWQLFRISFQLLGTEASLTEGNMPYLLTKWLPAYKGCPAGDLSLKSRSNGCIWIYLSFRWDVCNGCFLEFEEGAKERIRGVAAMVWRGTVVPRYLLPSSTQKRVSFQLIWALGHVPGSLSWGLGRLLNQAISFLIERFNWINNSCVEDSSSSCTLKKFAIL